MQLAFSSNAYLNYPLEETVVRIAAIGYRGMELLADVPHAWPAGLLPQRRREIRECLDRHGMTISNINGFMMNAVADPRQPYWHPSGLNPIRTIAPFAANTPTGTATSKDLGSPSIQTEPGGPLEPGQSWQAAANIFYDEIMPCVELAEKLEVLLLIEPEPGLLIEQLRAIPGVHEPHSFAVDRTELRHRPCLLRWRGPAGLDRPDVVAHEALSPGRHPRVAEHVHTIPGRGAIDFPAVLRRLRQAGIRVG